MTQLVEVLELLGPCVQGRSTPYRCRGDDDQLYYVKGRNTGRASQWSEWIGGHLGKALGLPIPPFRLVNISQELLDEAPLEWRELGVGPAFASQAHPTAQWFETTYVTHVSEPLQQDVLVFDWWIRNADRSRGNPNLLWDDGERSIVVIDHNQAFDLNFDPAEFHDLHIFAGVGRAIFDDLVSQARYAERLVEALAVWDEACDNAPLEWRWANDEQDVPANFDLAAARAWLDRCSTAEFWRMV